LIEQRLDLLLENVVGILLFPFLTIQFEFYFVLTLLKHFGIDFRLIFQGLLQKVELEFEKGGQQDQEQKADENQD
jgi:hypothetical protein